MSAITGTGSQIKDLRKPYRQPLRRPYAQRFAEPSDRPEPTETGYARQGPCGPTPCGRKSAKGKGLAAQPQAVDK